MSSKSEQNESAQVPEVVTAAEETEATAPAAAAGEVEAPASPEAETAPASAPEPAQAVADGVGLGIDIVDIARMDAILTRTPSFARRIFSEEERAYCNGTGNPAAHYATRFASKEAFLKALGTGFTQGIRPRDIEVKRNAKGQPRLVLHGAAKEAAEARGVVGMPLSLSFTHLEAVACVMVVTRDSVAAMQKRQDPVKELSKQFKEVRSLLDDLPTKGVEDYGE